jgi:hypothetical protein
MWWSITLGALGVFCTFGTFFSATGECKASEALAASKIGRVYQLTGIVSDLSDEIIALKQGHDVYTFERTPAEKASGKLDHAKKGDRVTVWYRLEAHQARIEGPEEPDGQQPRQPPSQQPGRLPPREPTIQFPLDDRAFFDV